MQTIYISVQGQNLLKEFQTVFRSSKETLSLTDKLEWWRRRASLDAKLKVTYLSQNRIEQSVHVIQIRSAMLC